MTERDWEKILAEEGMPADLPDEKGVRLGDGLGRISAEADEKEDDGIDSPMCPLVLGHAIDDTNLNQPSDRPTEDAATKGK